LEGAQIKKIIDEYEPFMKNLALQYVKAGSPGEFPIPIKDFSFGHIQFDHEADEYQRLLVEWGTISLDSISFFTEFAKADDLIPDCSTYESWELFRRSPTFFAYNPNSESDTKFEFIPKSKVADIKKKDNVSVILARPESNDEQVELPKVPAKVVQTKTQHLLENACLIMKDLSFDPLVKCKSKNSLGFLLKKACLRDGLELIGLRLVYLDSK